MLLLLLCFQSTSLTGCTCMHDWNPTDQYEGIKAKHFCFIVCNYLCSLCLWLSMWFQFCKIQLDLSCSFVAASDGGRGRGLWHYIICYCDFSSSSKGRAFIESYGSALLLIWWGHYFLTFLYLYIFRHISLGENLTLWFGSIPKTMFFKCVHNNKT